MTFSGLKTLCVCLCAAQMAMTVMPVFMLPLMIFSGFFVNSGTIPPYFNWISYISPMK